MKRQRNLRLPASKGKYVCQALFSNGATRGGRAGGDRYRRNGKPRGESDTANKNSQGSSSSNPPAPTQDTSTALYKVKGNVYSLLGTLAGNTWSQCKARITPSPEQTSDGGSQGQNNGRETPSCLAKCMFGTIDDRKMRNAVMT